MEGSEPASRALGKTGLATRLNCPVAVCPLKASATLQCKWDAGHPPACGFLRPATEATAPQGPSLQSPPASLSLAWSPGPPYCLPQGPPSSWETGLLHTHRRQAPLRSALLLRPHCLESDTLVHRPYRREGSLPPQTSFRPPPSPPHPFPAPSRRQLRAPSSGPGTGGSGVRGPSGTLQGTRARVGSRPGVGHRAQPCSARGQLAPARAGTPARRALSPGSPHVPPPPEGLRGGVFTSSRAAPPASPGAGLQGREGRGPPPAAVGSSRVPAAPSCPQVYVNAVWHGWAIPMFLFLAILRLSLNYLIAR